MSGPLYHTFARVVRVKEMDTAPTFGQPERSSFFPARARIELDCRGDGWSVSATVANSLVEEEASKQKLLDALRTAVALVEASQP